MSPAGLFRSKVKDRFGARRLVEQSPTIVDRILLLRRRQFVHEAFNNKYSVGRTDTAPESSLNTRGFHPHILDVHVRKRIGEIDCALCGIGIEAILEPWRKPSRNDRGAREAVVPGDWLSVLIETCGESVKPIGPVHVVLDIFLAGPHDLDGTVNLLRDLNCANDAVALQSPAKPAADQMI